MSSSVFESPLNKSAIWDFTGNMDISSICNAGVSELEQLGIFIKKTIEEEEQTLNHKYLSAIKKNPEGKDDVVENFAPDFYKIEEIFKRSLYYSYVVTIYCLLETKLYSICELAKENDKIELSYRDIKGKGLDQIKTYIKKVLQYDFTKSLSNQWEQIHTLNKIRNAIVHREGYIREKDLNDIKKLIEQKLVDLNGVNRIEIKHEYGTFILKNIYEFVSTICDELLMKNRNKEISV